MWCSVPPNRDQLEISKVGWALFCAHADTKPRGQTNPCLRTLGTNEMPKNSQSHDFQTLLTEAGIEFRSTPDFMPCPVRENDVFRYQYAELSPAGDLEVRYQIDSLVRLEAERNAAAVGMEVLASVSLDQMYSVNLMAILFNLSGGMVAEPTVLKPETSALLYGADWSALGFVRLANNDFTSDYDSAYVLALHKDGVADVYVIGLYKELSKKSKFFDKNNLPQVVKSNLAPKLRFS